MLIFNEKEHKFRIILIYILLEVNKTSNSISNHGIA